MINGRFEDITAQDIQSLVDNAVPEGRTIDYKAKLPENDNESKKEFLADVSSFANAAGGDLLFGVEEASDAHGRNTGVPDSAMGLSGINADGEILRLENMIRDGIAPRIQGIRTRAIDGFSDGPVVVMRIPNSWAAPHMVVFRNWSRFFSRTSNGKYQLDVTEIRAAFALSAQLTDRIARFRDERLGKIMADSTPVQLEAKPKVVLHLLPLSAFDPGALRDVTADLTPELRDHVQPIDAYHSHRRHNLDGYLSYRVQREGRHIAYAQLFRSGAVETVSVDTLREWGGQKTLPFYELAEAVKDSVRHYLRLLNGLETGLPIYTYLTLIGANGYELSSQRLARHRRYQPPIIDRDILHIPEIIVEDFGVDPDQLLKPLFDVLWQAAGLERCLNYDENGNWIVDR